MGRLYTLDETDILNDPRESPYLDKQGVHARVEKVYGLWAAEPGFDIARCKKKKWHIIPTPTHD